MTITTQDVKLFKSERITDNADGGGRQTGNEVIDGELNNVFDDTSRDDRVNGRVSLRKVFGAVTTPDVQKFLGAHSIISDPPDDGRVYVTLFKLPANGAASERDEAKEYIEAYVVPAESSLMVLYDIQPQGARTLIAYQNPTDPLPDVNEVLVLSIEGSGQANQGYTQYARITELQTDIITIGVGSNAYQKRLITMEISDALNVNFPGGDFAREPTLNTSPTRVRKVDVNPVAKFYGVVPTTEAIAPTDTNLKVQSILQPIAPTAYAETPLLDRSLGPEGSVVIDASERTQSRNLGSLSSGVTKTFSLPPGVAPGSVTLNFPSSNTVLKDQGDGTLVKQSGSLNASGTIDYVNGTLTYVQTGINGGSSNVTWKKGAAVSQVQETTGIEITIANRGFNYNRTLLPMPYPGSVVVTYRALGRWYTLTDNGQGQLVGATGTGAGTVNYVTGTVNVTVGYQPDVESYVLFAWGTQVHYVIAESEPGIAVGHHLVQTVNPVEPGSLLLEYSIGASDYTINDDGAGQLTGHASGTIDYTTGEIRAALNQVPAPATDFSISYDGYGAYLSYTPDPQPTPDGSDDVNITIPGAPLKAGSVRIATLYENASDENLGVSFLDNGDGTFRTSAGRYYSQSNSIGTINYTTGAVSIPGTLQGVRYNYSPGFGSWASTPSDYTFVQVNSAAYKDDVAGGSFTETFTPISVISDFSAAMIHDFVNGSLLFEFQGKLYFDQNGSLFTIESEAATTVGTFDPSTGIAILNDWGTGARNASAEGLLTRYGLKPLEEVFWRTAGAPLRPQSFQVTNGETTAVADEAGDFSATGISGSVNIETGVYLVEFTPGITPELGRYNAVVIKYLPLDPELLGLNPSRLPLSGEVPIITPGDTLVIHDTETEELANPVVAGQTYALSRDLLAYAVVYDDNGVKVSTDQYTVNLPDGEVTFANPLDLSEYTQPLSVEHRIEDMVLCQDSQLSGDVQISGSIVHSYDAGALISSAMRFGTLQGRVTDPFDQQSWTGVWSDERIGSDATAEFNNTTYPITTTNEGAITERWRLEFTTSNDFRLIGETTGVIATGNIGSDFSPNNPNAGAPYMTVPALGFGSGWVAGNQIRFNTFGASAPIWLNRCTLQGPEEEPTDSVRLEFRGDSQ